MKLCLLVSRRCNLRCGFCRVEFTGKDMDWPTAEAAVAGYLSALPDGAAPIVKFFGGEPLLNFDLIRRLVESSKGMRFELATNGSFLDDDKKAFFREHPEVDVTVSQEPEKGSGLPDAWYTMVLAQDCEPRLALGKVKELLDLGYRRFNVLPAYYVPWTPAELDRLSTTLQALARFFNGLRSLGRPVRIKNQEVVGPVPLYNDALTADVDGAIYASNMVQSEGMEPYRESLRLGRVDDPLPWTLRPAPAEALAAAISAWAGPQAWDSTRRVDALLTSFVERLILVPQP